MSTPFMRTIWLLDDSSDTRQPTEQVWQVDSVVTRSHGRARKRYELAVSAPTGQICTVLPLK